MQKSHCPVQSEAIELRVLPEFTATDSRYRISLARINPDDKREQLAQIEHLSAGDDGMVTVYLNAPRIAPGDYEVTIANDATSAEQTSRFLHPRVARQPAQLDESRYRACTRTLLELLTSSITK